MEGKNDIQRKTLTRFDAAEYLGVSVLTIDRKLRDGDIDHYRIGRRVVFDENQLDRFLEKNERKAR